MRASIPQSAEQFHLSPPEVHKVNTQSQFLVLGDVNGDGNLDVLTVDNRKSLLEIHVQKEPGGEKRFERQERILERVVRSLDVADLNGDGRADVLIGAAPPAIVYQDKAGGLGGSTEIHAPGVFAAAGDLNGDGRSDVVVFDKDRFSLLFQTAGGELGQAREFPNAVATDQPPELVDLNGDGRIDLVYADAQKKNEVAVRYQQAPGEFGPEVKRDIGFFRQLTFLKGKGTDRSTALVTVEQRTNALKLMEQSAPTSGSEAYSAGPVQLLALPANARPAGVNILAADLDGDGLDNLALFSRDLAEATFYGWNRSGTFVRRTRPVLADVIAVVAPSEITSPPLYLMSKKEEMIAVMRPDRSRLYTVPQPIDVRATPLAIASGDLDGDGHCDLLYCVRNSSGTLDIFRRRGDDSTHPSSTTAGMRRPTGSPASGRTGSWFSLFKRPGRQKQMPSDTHVASIEQTSGDEPTAMDVRDLDGNGLPDLLVFFEYRPVEILMQNDRGHFRRLGNGQGPLKGLLSDARPGRLWIADIDADGREEVLVARERFARALRIETGGGIAVVEQFNGKNPGAEINAVATGDLNGDGSPEVLLLDRANNVVTVYARQDDGAFQLATNIDVPGLQLYRLLVGRLNDDATDDLIILSDRSLAVLFGGGRQVKLLTRWRRQSKLEDGYYALAESGDVDGDGNDEILALENSEHVLEFYRANASGDPTRFYRFKVFDDLRASPFSGRRREAPPEPREMAVGDLNGDGRRDLVLLTHDRLLVYYQKKP